MFGTSNRDSNFEYHDFGKSGNVIKTGAGILEQTKVSNVFYYTDFSLKLLNDALLELSTNKLDYKDRKFVLTTGQRGAILFHQAVLQTTSGWTQFVFDNSSLHVVDRTQSNLHDNALTAGFQFVGFKAPNGVEVSLQINDYYDKYKIVA